MSPQSSRVVREVIFPTPEDVPVKLRWRRTEGGCLHSLAVHAEVEIQYIKLGIGAYVIGRRIWPFRCRNMFVIQPNVPHRFQPNPQGVVEKAFVAFRPSWLKEHWIRAMIPTLPVSLHLTEQDATPIEACYRTFRSELATKRPHWDLLMKSELAKLLVLIQRVAQQKNPAPTPDNRVIKAIEYLDTHFQDAITVPGLAKIVAMSPSHLAHRFKQYIRMGIRQYLLQRRIVEAKMILEQTPDVKLTALAAQLGFCNFALFNRAFQRLTDMSPSDWRRLSHVQSRK
ncbi:MAG: AraC family transcriptional regulator [Kiritimatiellia bacterium]|nr:AraC family transcriptional regulator [Kiritimatiellia bacterium]